MTLRKKRPLKVSAIPFRVEVMDEILKLDQNIFGKIILPRTPLVQEIKQTYKCNYYEEDSYKLFLNIKNSHIYR